MAHEVTARRVLYEIPGMRSVAVRRRDFRGADGEPLPMAIYAPSAADSAPTPAVVIVEGYPDPGFASFLGCRFMDMAWSVSTAELVAASGMAAVTYANREPAADAVALLDDVRANARTLGLDAGRIGLWATSGHAPTALSILAHAACAVLSNPYTFDHGGATDVAQASQMFKFAPPAVTAIPSGKPLFVVRSGKDEMPGLNASLDRFVTLALSVNHPLTLVNHADAPHAFELVHDSETTRQIVQQALVFLAVTLRVP